jgi:hypothetical protein
MRGLGAVETLRTPAVGRFSTCALDRGAAHDGFERVFLVAASTWRDIFLLAMVCTWRC